MNALSGWVLLDKPKGMTSQRAVTVAKRALKHKKAGHTGTLDPMATGVLPIAFGEATKLTSLLLHADKTYLFEISWGVQTDSDDADGTPIDSSENRPSHADVDHALSKFLGPISQTPPVHSAIHVQGKRAYVWAHAGETVDMPTRTVRIDSFECLEHGAEVSTFRVQCGSGTYVRSLARDLAEALGTKGHVSMLRREAVGPISISETTSLDGPLTVHPLEWMLEKLAFPTLDVTAEDAASLQKGQSIANSVISQNIACRHKEKLIALAHTIETRLFPHRVFSNEIQTTRMENEHSS